LAVVKEINRDTKVKGGVELQHIDDTIKVRFGGQA
jgi:hypothetical protein